MSGGKCLRATQIIGDTLEQAYTTFGPLWPAKTPNFVCLASFFWKKHPLNVLKHIIFDPWICEQNVI